VTAFDIRRFVTAALLLLPLALAGCGSAEPRPEPVPPVTVAFADGKTLLPDGYARRRVLAEAAKAVRGPLDGYQIVSTIQQRLQQILELATTLPGQPVNLQAAAVVTEPKTGRVLAYFGGPAGAEVDYSAMPHPPGLSFAAYDLAAALTAGISTQSRWQAPASMAFPASGRTDHPVTDTKRCPQGATACTLADAANGGLRIPLYAVTDKIGAGKVIEFAGAAGIDSMQVTVDGGPRAIDLRTAKSGDVVPKYFGTEVGIGQYGVSVVDHSNGMATLAAGGERATSHLVATISKLGKTVYTERLDPASTGLPPAAAANLTWALSQQPAGRLSDGRRTAAVTGTWLLGNRDHSSAHAWIAGYTPRYAMAVWVGNKADEQPLKDHNGEAVTGETLPAQIYRKVLGEALKGTAITQPTQPPPYGDVKAGNAG
jgi:membrane peptidoglycan carboxypeptidase